MAIERPELDGDLFTPIPKTQSRCPGLSLKEKGLLEYFASHKAGYELTIAQIIEENEDGRESVDNAIKGLERKGYLERTGRVRNPNGTLGAYNYRLIQRHGVSAGQNQCGFPHTGYTRTGPDQAKQDVSAGGNQCGSTSAGSPAHKEDQPKKTNKKNNKTSMAAVAAADAQSVNKTPDDDTPARPEVERLCQLLADLIAADGSKRPPVTKAWRDECRRLMDLDKATEKQVEYVIRWSQRHHFWSTNILSMPTLRKQYERLVKVIKAEQVKPVSGGAPAKSFQQKEREHGQMAASLTQQALTAWRAQHPDQEPTPLDMAYLMQAVKQAAVAVENIPANQVSSCMPTGYSGGVIEGVSVETAQMAIGGAA